MCACVYVCDVYTHMHTLVCTPPYAHSMRFPPKIYGTRASQYREVLVARDCALGVSLGETLGGPPAPAQ